MTPSARLQAVLELLTSIDTVARPADALISGYYRARRYIGSKDRAAISEQTYAVLRHYARMTWWVEKLGATPSALTRLLAYLVLIEEQKPALIDGLCHGEQFAPPQLSETEKRLLKKLSHHTLDHPEMPEEVRAECPAWAAAGLQRRFGKSFMKEMAALQNPAPLDLRVNPLKTTREKAMNALRSSDIVVETCRYAPLGLRVRQRPALNRITLLRDGAIEIQDEGSQLVALLVDAKPGERIVDFCAGAGGKTLALSAQMQNKGRIIACDVLENRLKRSGERFRRAGLHNIETRPLSSEVDPWVKRHKGAFDRVLVDAPCSGTGTWRRNPDARWRSLGPGLEALLPLQGRILTSAARLVKAGGRLVYATCSMLPEENEHQIESFLAEHRDFRLVPVTELAGDIMGPSYSSPYLSLTPAQHQTDGFFAAVMERLEAQPVPSEPVAS